MPIIVGTKRYPDILPQPLYPIALRVSGRVGYAYVFKQYGNNRMICKYYYPYNPKTEGQTRVRNYFAQAVANWQTFDDRTKQFYNEMRYPNIASGYNRYISRYLEDVYKD